MLLALLALKGGWVAACTPDVGDSSGDLLARRDHLLSRTQSATYDSDHQLVPGGVFSAEWKLVTLSMTAAALTNLSFQLPETRLRHRPACDGLLERMLQPDIRAFEVHQWGSDPLADLDGPNGHAGYLGHLGFTLGACRLLGGAEQHADLHDRVAEALARRMRASRSWHVATYPGETYTADNSVVVAALALHDLVTGRRRHQPTLVSFVSYSRERLLDPSNGLTVFAVSDEGRPLGHGRGSAAGYSSFYLPFADRTFAAEQRAQLRKHFVVDMGLGMTGVREYSDDGDHSGDVDTGPLVFGLSPSATGFALASARHDRDVELEQALLRTAEAAGFTLPCRGGRCYALAPLVGDAILLAMRTATRWDRRFL